MSQTVQKKLKNQKGFTLIELLADIIDYSKKDAQDANAQQMINAAKTAASDNNLSPTSSPPVFLLLDYLQQKQYIENFKDPDSDSYTADTYTPDTKAANGNVVPGKSLTAQPTENVSYIEISLDNNNKLVYSSLLYGSKRHIPLTESSALNRSLVVNN